MKNPGQIGLGLPIWITHDLVNYAGYEVKKKCANLTFEPEKNPLGPLDKMCNFIVCHS
jgi:hypothetical protein